MDAMEHGSNGEGGDPVNSALKIVNLQKKDEGSIPNPNFDQTGLNPGRGIRFKPVGDRNLVTLACRPKNSSKNSNVKSTPNFGPRVTNLDYSSQYLDAGYDKEEDDGGGGGEFEDGFLVETPIGENLVPVGYRGKDFGKIHKNSSQGFAPRHQSDHRGDDDDDGSGFRVKSSGYQESERPGLRPRKFSKVEKVNPNFWDDGGNVNNQVDADGELWVKVPRERNLAPGGFRGKYSGKAERNSNPNFDTSGLNGYSSVGKKSGGGGGGIKRENVAVTEMVSSIKLLGDGFMKMEKMKMEMAREIEKMRMETEMKRNELILESQKQIVDAFVKGLVESKKKKQKPTVATES